MTIKKQHTPRLIWELKLPIDSRLHHKVFMSISDECYNAVYQPIYKNIINSVGIKYERKLV